MSYTGDWIFEEKNSKNSTLLGESPCFSVLYTEILSSKAYNSKAKNATEAKNYLGWDLWDQGLQKYEKNRGQKSHTTVPLKAYNSAKTQQMT